MPMGKIRPWGLFDSLVEGNLGVTEIILVLKETIL